MADIRNSSFNDIAALRPAFLSVGKPADFTGLARESEDLDHELGDLPRADHGTSGDAPAPGFATRSARAMNRIVGDGSQGADSGKKAQAGEHKGDEGPSADGGKHEGQAAERQGADRQGGDTASARSGAGREGSGREGSGREGFNNGGAGKDKSAIPMSTASQGNAQARKGGNQANQTPSRNPGNTPNAPHNQPALAQGGAGLGGTSFSAAQLASQLIGQAAAGAALPGALPMPGAGLPQAAGTMSAPASPQAAATAANQYAATPQGLFASQIAGNGLKLSASKGSTGKDAVGEDADDGAEDSSDETAGPRIRKRRMAQPPVTGKQTSDSDSGNGSGSDDGHASGEDSAAGAAGDIRSRRKREAVASSAAPKGAPLVDGKNDVSDGEFDDIDPRDWKRAFTQLASQAWKGAFDEKAGTVDSYRKMEGLVSELMASMPSSAKQDPRYRELMEQSKLLQRYLRVKSERQVNPDTPSRPSTTSTLMSADSKLAAAIATGDVFEIVYAIMSVMFGSATENTRQRALKVRQINSDQERIRSTQQKVRALAQGFKPGADGSTKLSDKGDGKSKEALTKLITDTQTELDDVGWDPTTYGGGKSLSGETTKQQLDDLVSNMDSRLTSYNNMNSLETNDLTREAQAAQAYLTGMNGILTKENQALSAIATSFSR